MDHRAFGKAHGTGRIVLLMKISSQNVIPLKKKTETLIGYDVSSSNNAADLPSAMGITIIYIDKGTFLTYTPFSIPNSKLG
jgi:hypothetical protein